MNKFGLAAIVAASACASVPATAAVVQWTSGAGANGHYYEFVSGATTWDLARAAALASTHAGQSGYLATVTSAEENAFLSSVSASTGFLGGTDSAVEGTWIWADGPEANQIFWQNGSTLLYANWNGGEPNNVGNEDVLHTNFVFLGGWNDIPATSQDGYFVEYNGVINPIPEPATWALMIAGFGLVGGAMRRRDRMAAAIA